MVANYENRCSLAEMIEMIEQMESDSLFVGFDPKRRFEEVVGYPLDSDFF